MSRDNGEPQCFSVTGIFTARKLAGEYQFQLKGIEIPFRVRVYRDYKPNVKQHQYFYTQSHYIQTPMQAGPYVTSSPFSYDEITALEKAVDGIYGYYREAVEAGHKPSNSWLREDEDFEK